MRHCPSFHLARTYAIWPQWAIMTGFAVLPDWEPTASMALTTSMPLVTVPKTTCLPSSQSVLTVQRKNLRVYRRRCASFIDALLWDWNLTLYH